MHFTLLVLRLTNTKIGKNLKTKGNGLHVKEIASSLRFHRLPTLDHGFLPELVKSCQKPPPLALGSMNQALPSKRQGENMRGREKGEMGGNGRDLRGRA